MSNPKVVFEPVGDETPLTMDQYQQFSKNIQTTLARGLTTAARIIEGGDTQ